MSVINTYGMPFNDTAGDREYGTGDWRDYYKNLHNSGVIRDIDNELEVTQAGTPAKTVEINTGSILINGAMINSDQVKTLTFADNTSGNPRIDRVVARLDNTNRFIEFDVIQGTPAGSPTAPALTQTTTTYELSLAQVYLANGYTTITNSVITDERSSLSVCGYASVNTGLKATSNTFTRSSGQVVGSGVSEVLWTTQGDTSNPYIYLSSNKIYIHESVKIFWATFSIYTSNTNYAEILLEYPSGSSFGSSTYTANGVAQTISHTISFAGTTQTEKLKTNINVVGGTTVQSSFLTYVRVTALYI